MSYTVNDDTIRLNGEATKISQMERRITADANDLWLRIQRDLLRHQELMLELGSVREQLARKESELEEAVRRG